MDKIIKQCRVWHKW